MAALYCMVLVCRQHEISNCPNLYHVYLSVPSGSPNYTYFCHYGHITGMVLLSPPL